MIINIPTETLVGPMKNIASVSDPKQTLPILGNTLIQLKDRVLTLLSSDLEVEVCYSCDVDYDGEISSTIPSRKFADILKSLDADVTSLEFEDNSVIIKGGKSRFKVATLPASDFPISDPGETEDIKIDAEKLTDLMNKTSFSMGYQDARHFLNGLYLECNENTLVAVATDGHRLALSETQVGDLAGMTTCIIPRKCISELKRILTTDNVNKENLITIGINSKNLIAKTNRYVVKSKLIEGKYPDYRKVFPDDLPNTLKLNKSSFKSALHRMSILSSEQYKGVKLSLGTSSLDLTTTNPLQEKGEDNIDCTYDGEPMEVGFNLAYLLEVIDVIDTETVQLRFGSQDTGCLVTSDESTPKSKYIIMPMRV
tara:strand:+ start:821 stop:1927 length:1107 start_codon:yes stop_codon:yes gene_type:complete